jgi:hypothetical protein
MEDHRLDVTPESIIEYFQRAIEAIDGIPAHFVFNADEMGRQRWANRDERTYFVPVSHPEDQVPHPVSRAGKRIPLLACIAADGFLRGNS